MRVSLGRIRSGVVCFSCCLLVTVHSAEAAKFSTFVVSVNGVSSPDTANVSVNPGDVIELEFWGSEWSPEGQRLRSWQIAIDCDGYTSGDAGELVPLGFDDPQFDMPCTSDDDCEPSLICYLIYGTSGYCAGPNNDPTLGGFVDESRSDYVYFNKPVIVDPFLSPLCYRFGAIMFNAFDAPVFTVPRYFATLILKASDDACGTFTVGADPDNSFMRDINGNDILPLEVDPVMINVNSGLPCRLARNINTGLVLSEPVNCIVDARQTEDPDGSNPAGLHQFKIRLACPGECSSLTASDFVVNEMPEPEFPVFTNTITDVRIEGNKAVLTWRRALMPGSWTCARYRGEGGGQVCVGGLPGDVGSDGTTDAADVLDEINCLTKPGSCELHQCDADRSGDCATADLLRVIDLLNGSGTYVAWMGEVLGRGLPCPSAAP